MITDQIVEILTMVDYDLFSLAAVVVGNSYSDSLSMKVSSSLNQCWLVVFKLSSSHPKNFGFFTQNHHVLMIF